MTRQLFEMIDWLTELKVTHVAMESTGGYWKPVHNLLENIQLEVVVANPRYVKAVPGRKTDVKDAEWIADLLRHGLIRASFIPSREQRELRELFAQMNETRSIPMYGASAKGMRRMKFSCRTWTAVRGV